MEVERVEVVDLSAGAAVAGERRPTWERRPAPLLLTAALVGTLAAGVIGSVAVASSDRAQVRADEQLSVTVILAHPDPGPTVAAPVRAGADVTLDLRVSVPVRVLDAQLDGAPPVTRVPGTGGASRTPSVTVRWAVLCAEVGTIPGPRLLDVDLRSRSSDQHRRITISTSDNDPIARVFRLEAAQECEAGRS